MAMSSYPITSDTEDMMTETTAHRDASAGPAEGPAVWIFEHGGPEVLRYGSYPLDEVGPRDVLVDVDAVGVTGFDLKYRRGVLSDTHLPGRDPFPLPQRLGREAAGTVVRTGDEVTAFAPGDSVVAVTHPEDPDGIDTARGLGNLSSGLAIPGHQARGSYARFVARDERMWLPLAGHVDREQAALTLWAFSTAHRLLVDRLRVGLGDVIVVLGATGATGVATIQLARLLGARPVATTRDVGKADQLAALGAVDVVDVTDLDDATGRLDRLTGGQGADHLIDFVGDHDVLARMIPSMRLGGTVGVAAGEESPDPLPIRARDLIRAELAVVGVRGARRIDMLTSLDLLTRGQISIPVAARFPLSKAAEAHAAMEAGLHSVGRTVLVPER